MPSRILFSIKIVKGELSVIPRCDAESKEYW